MHPFHPKKNINIFKTLMHDFIWNIKTRCGCCKVWDLMCSCSNLCAVCDHYLCSVQFMSVVEGSWSVIGIIEYWCVKWPAEWILIGIFPSMFSSLILPLPLPLFWLSPPPAGTLVYTSKTGSIILHESLMPCFSCMLIFLISYKPFLPLLIGIKKWDPGRCSDSFSFIHPLLIVFWSETWFFSSFLCCSAVFRE